MTLIELSPTTRMEKSEVHENLTELRCKYRRSGMVITTYESLYGVPQSRILLSYRMADMKSLVLVPKLLTVGQRQNILALVRGIVVELCVEDTLDSVVVRETLAGIDRFRAQLQEQQSSLRLQVRGLQQNVHDGYGVGYSLGMTDSNAIMVLNSLCRAVSGMERNPLKSVKSGS